MMWRAVVIVVCFAACAAGAWAQGLGAPAAEQAPEEFAVELRRMSFHVAWPFKRPTGYSYEDHSWGVRLLPRFEVRPLRGAPIIGAEPRVRVTRLIDGDGNDLMAKPAEGAGGAGGSAAWVYNGDDWSKNRVAYLFPSGGDGSSTCYQGAVATDSSGIVLGRLPASIREMEGLVSASVVTEDLSREFGLGKNGYSGEIAPGVQLDIALRGGHNDQSVASFRVTAQEGKSTPHLNFVETTCVGQTDVIPFQRRVTSTGSSGRTEWFLPGRDYGEATCRVHLVYGTRVFRKPFRIENIPISGAGAFAASAPNDAEQARRGRNRDFATVTDGYEVRLLSVRAGGEYRDATEPPAGPMRLLMDVGVLDTRGDRVWSRFARVVFDEIVDDAGRNMLAPGGVRVTDDRGVGGGTRYLPRPALESGGHDYRDAGRGRVLSASMDAGWIPARLARVRGSVEILEAKREVVRDVELTPQAEPIELAPGVSVFIREPTIQANVLPEQPRGDWVEVVIDGSAVVRGPMADSQAPLLNMVQVIRADGTADTPDYSVLGARSGTRLTYTIGQNAFLRKAVKLRMHVVVEAERRTLPFEFTDVPCGCP